MDIVEKLRAIADGMDEAIERAGADRLANTPKRQRQAQSARQEADRLRRTQAGLYAIAEREEIGELPSILAKIKSKAAAYELAREEIDHSRAGYYDAGIQTGRPALSTPEALAFWALLKPKSETENRVAKLKRMTEALMFADIPGYFPTPAPVVDLMLEHADLDDGMTVLEPSAGSGAIIDRVSERFPRLSWIACEVNHSLRQILTLKGHAPQWSDFDEIAGTLDVDRVLMNPPFENGTDARHVRRAFEHLKPGGRLVAVMSPGPFFRKDRASEAFQNWADEMGAERIDLPANSFKASGTGVGTCLFIAERQP